MAKALPIKLFFLSLIIISLTSCSSRKNPVIYYNEFDFSQVKNYSFYGSDSTFFDSQSLTHSQRNRIELAIEKSLNSQSFNYTTPESADIIVTYHWVKNSPKDYQAYNKSILFCQHCLKANTWQKVKYDWVVYPGGLIIDLVDPKKNRSVWRSIHPLKFKTKDNSMKRNEKLTYAVEAMLSQYPSN